MIRNQGPMDLPDRARDAGVPPLAQPEYVNRIAAVWQDEYDAEEGYGRARSLPEAGPYRGSFASIRCDRQLHYAMTEVPCDNGCEWGKTATTHDCRMVGNSICPKCEGTGKIPLPQSNPPTIADKWRFKTGKWVHAEIEKLLPQVFPTAEAEVVVDLRPIGIPGSAHADMINNDEVIEIKSVGGFSHKMMSTTFNGPPEGPKEGSILQAALAAAARNADRVRIIHLSLENLSPKMASSFADTELGRFASEWVFDIEGLMPDVEAEVRRVNRLLKFQGTDILPARELHDKEAERGAVVTDPKRGVWEVHNADGGLTASRTTWRCMYCPHQDRCIKDGAS